MRRYGAVVVTCGLAMILAACATQTSQGGGGKEAPAVGVPAPASSPLSKVQVGMNKKQVKDVLGAPTDENSYSTGKAWIPFYFGNDARRTSYYYKGMGRVVFADGNVFGGGSPEVVRVDYDPSESGVAR
ncbi:MAG TPA: outer membrane protein assembly factor BamE [Candidatus Margulisiibacteriota bacterium]|nr:outer membrane protein assembly factor BamE [Candidatus Margulisiibacteriota bacterium]